MADSDRPIFSIDIDDSKFDAYAKKVKNVRKDMQDSGGDFEKLAKESAGMNSSFEQAAKHFDGIFKEAKDPRFGRAFDMIGRAVVGIGKGWEAVSKSLDKAHSKLLSMEKLLSGAGNLAKLAFSFGIGGIAGAFGAGVKSIDSMAGKNAQNRRLGLAPGEQQNFENTYGKYGADAGLLERIADARNDPNKLSAFAAAGLSQDQVQTMSLPALAATMLEKMSSQVKAQPGFAQASFANATGYDSLMDLGGLRQAGSYGPEDFAESRRQFSDQAPQYAQKQSDLDQATTAKQKLDAAWDKLVNSIETVFLKLSPLITKIADKFAEVVMAFAKSGKIEEGIDKIVSAFDKLNNWLHKLDDALAKKGIGGIVEDKAKTFTDGVAETRERLEKFFMGKTEDSPADTKPVDKKAPAQSDAEKKFIADPDREKTIAALEKKFGMPAGYLAAHEQIESRGGTDNINPKNPNVLGAMQFDEPTAKQYGVDRYSEKSSLEGGAKLLADRRNKYGGSWAKASASFDGFRGLDSDISKYGDAWEDHIGEFQKNTTETTDYLKKLRKTVALPRDDAGASQPGQDTASTIAKQPRKSEPSEGQNSQLEAQLARMRNMSAPGALGGPMRLPQLQVSVNSPAGSNVGVTSGGMTQ